MIQQQTLLNVSDNSGAKIVKCIKVLGGFKRKIAYIGDLIIVVIYKLRNKSKSKAKVKKGEIFKALIVKTKYSKIRPDGSLISFGKNSVVLLNKQGKPLSNRIIGPISSKIKKSKFSKIAALATGTI
jgi:large subunit ribosomal protein L14